MRHSTSVFHHPFAIYSSQIKLNLDGKETQHSYCNFKHHHNARKSYIFSMGGPQLEKTPDLCMIIQDNHTDSPTLPTVLFLFRWEGMSHQTACRNQAVECCVAPRHSYIHCRSKRYKTDSQLFSFPPSSSTKSHFTRRRRRADKENFSFRYCSLNVCRDEELTLKLHRMSHVMFCKVPTNDVTLNWVAKSVSHPY